MGFWIRQIIMIAVIVWVPALVLSWQMAVETVYGAQDRAMDLVKAARVELEAELQAEALARLNQALVVAQEFSAEDIMGQIAQSRTRPAALAVAQSQLATAAGERGFAWLVDEEGILVAENTPDTGKEPKRSVAGHPVFKATQQGFGLYDAWQEAAVFVSAVPVVDGGFARGAVIVGHPFERAFLDRMAKTTGAQITFEMAGNVRVSTLPDELRDRLSQRTDFGGHKLKLIETRTAPVIDGPLPVFVDRHLPGAAYAVGQYARRDRGKWLLSMEVSEGYAKLAQDQTMVFGLAIAASLLLLIANLLSRRTFMQPRKRIEEHLANLTQGLTDAEMPEMRVSKPFRRTVRLINMLAQRGNRNPGLSTVPGADLGRLHGTGSLSGSLSGGFMAPAPQDSLLQGMPGMSQQELRSEDLARIGPSGELPSLDAVAPSPLASDAAGAMDHLSDAAPAMPPNDEHAAAIAEAIASLHENEMGVDDDFSVSESRSVPQSASSIRGVPAGRMGTDNLRSGGSMTPESPWLSEGLLGASGQVEDKSRRPDKTVVASVSPDLLAKSAAEHPDHLDDPLNMPSLQVSTVSPGSPDAEDLAHFKEVYEQFIEMRRQCGDTSDDWGYPRFEAKLTKNREALTKKYNCRTVRFQVYEKGGKAALKATPVRGGR